MRTIFNTEMGSSFGMKQNNNEISVDIVFNKISLFGIMRDASDDQILLKMWGTHGAFRTMNMDYHHINEWDRLIIVGVDDIDNCW